MPRHFPRYTLCDAAPASIGSAVLNYFGGPFHNYHRIGLALFPFAIYPSPVYVYPNCICPVSLKCLFCVLGSCVARFCLLCSLSLVITIVLEIVSQRQFELVIVSVNMAVRGSLPCDKWDKIQNQVRANWQIRQARPYPSRRLRCLLVNRDEWIVYKETRVRWRTSRSQ